MPGSPGGRRDPAAHRPSPPPGDVLRRPGPLPAERGWRTEAAESMRAHDALSGLDETILGVAAGRLVLVDRAEFDGITVHARGRQVGLPQADLAWILARRPPAIVTGGAEATGGLFGCDGVANVP